MHLPWRRHRVHMPRWRPGVPRRRTMRRRQGSPRRRPDDRHMDLAGGQRHPGTRWRWHPARPDRDAERHPRATDPGDERRLEDRRRGARARPPDPAPAPSQPAPVVGGCESPGHRIDPGPSPGPHPDPASVRERRPARRQRVRQPDGPVLGMAVPAAVAVEVLAAGDVRRHVTPGARLVRRRGAPRPGVEFVARHRDAARPDVAAVAVGAQLDALAGVELQQVAAADELQPPVPDRGPGRPVVAAVDAVMALGQRTQAALAGADFGLSRQRRAAQPPGQRAAVQLDDDARIVQRQHFELAVGAQAQLAAPDAKLGTVTGADGESVALGDRAVAPRRHPLALVAVPGPQRSLDIGDTAHARGDAVLVRRDHRRQPDPRETQDEGQKTDPSMRGHGGQLLQRIPRDPPQTPNGPGRRPVVSARRRGCPGIALAAGTSRDQSGGSPFMSGNSTLVNPSLLKSVIRVGYSRPIRWSHSCCTTRAWKPSASRSIGRPRGSNPR